MTPTQSRRMPSSKRLSVASRRQKHLFKLYCLSVYLTADRFFVSALRPVVNVYNMCVVSSYM